MVIFNKFIIKKSSFIRQSMPNIRILDENVEKLITAVLLYLKILK
jgi:hypothetical protein